MPTPTTFPFLTPQDAARTAHAAPPDAATMTAARASSAVVAAAAERQLGVTRTTPSFVTVLAAHLRRAATVARP